MLLYSDTNNESKKFLYLNSKEDIFIYKSIFENNIILNYKNLPNKLNNYKSEEEIVTINPILFNGSNNIDPHVMGIKLYPVLTISNNSDINRHQYDDSYIVIE